MRLSGRATGGARHLHLRARRLDRGRNGGGGGAEMKIKQGTEVKGVCKKWKSKGKSLCWLVPAFNVGADSKTRGSSAV